MSLQNTNFRQHAQTTQPHPSPVENLIVRLQRRNQEQHADAIKRGQELLEKRQRKLTENKKG